MKTFCPWPWIVSIYLILLFYSSAFCVLLHIDLILTLLHLQLFSFFHCWCKWHYAFNFNLQLFIAGIYESNLFPCINFVSCNHGILPYQFQKKCSFLLDFLHRWSCHQQTNTVLLIFPQSVYLLFPFIVLLL